MKYGHALVLPGYGLSQWHLNETVGFMNVWQVIECHWYQAIGSSNGDDVI